MSNQFEELRSELEQGRSQSNVITSMSQRGFTILDAIKATRELFGVSLGEAKDIVASHVAYRGIADASSPLQDEIIRSFEQCLDESTKNVRKS